MNKENPEKEKKKKEFDICPDVTLHSIHGAYLYQPLTYPDERNEHGIAIPTDHAIEAERAWNIEHKV